jgi:hypothetical protein
MLFPFYLIGMCEAQLTASTCLASKGLDTFDTTCAWDEASEKCSNNTNQSPVEGVVLMIVIMIIITPLNMMYDALVENFRQYLLITQGVLDLAREEAEAELLG